MNYAMGTYGVSSRTIRRDIKLVIAKLPCLFIRVDMCYWAHSMGP